MERNHYFLPSTAPRGFLNEISKTRDLYLPHPLEDDWRYRRWDEKHEEDIDIAPYRAVESLKNFLFPEQVVVASFPEPGGDSGEERETVILGLKACDLAALPVLDYIFLEGETSEPFYAGRREKTIIISADCTGFKEVCFCPMVGRSPFPREGFDLNLTPLKDGCLVESATEKGEELVKEGGDIFAPAAPEQLEERDKLREKVLSDLKDQLREQGQIAEAPTAAEVRENDGDPLWTEEAEPCVECGACNLVCPTCHCFLLEDLPAGAGSVKLRNWDSCQYPGFSRVAGGANPRPKRSERLNNRFSKKFEFFPEVAGVIACTGCGRCYEGCMGKIDIRSILARLKST